MDLKTSESIKICLEWKDRIFLLAFSKYKLMLNLNSSKNILLKFGTSEKVETV